MIIINCHKQLSTTKMYENSNVLLVINLSICISSFKSLLSCRYFRYALDVAGNYSSVHYENVLENVTSPYYSQCSGAKCPHSLSVCNNMSYSSSYIMSMLSLHTTQT